VDCDVVRFLFDEGLAIQKADISVDGRFVLMAFDVSADDHDVEKLRTAGTRQCAAADWAAIASGITELATAGCHLSDVLALNGCPVTKVCQVRA
jgi:hypothetical protein